MHANQCFKIITDVYNPVFGDDKEINNAWVPSLPLLHLTNPANTDGNELQLNIGCVPLQLQANRDRSIVVPSPFSIRLLASQHGLLERVAACVSANWLVLLTGPPHVGKRSTVRALATLVDQPLEHIRLTSETDALELLGSFEQVQNQQQRRGMENEDDNGDNKMVVDLDCDDDEMNGRQEEDDGLHASGSKSNLRFEWVDSVFVRAFRDGHWLLVDDVNCCSSAVLDCLNSCLESADGELVLPVQQQKHADGTVLESKICRHANFRIFFTMNPRNGQLSRAMRNRAVELAFGTDPDPGVEPPSWSADVVDVVSAVFMPNRITTESESSTSIRATMPSSLKQCQLVTQLQHTLQGSTDCSTMLCCAAQLPSRSRRDAGNNWMEEQPFLAGLEQFIQLLLRYSRMDDAAAGVVDDYDERSQPMLGFNTFPPVARPSASAISTSHDELTLYYWHCWSNVSAFPVQQHAPHSDVCLQLAFMFPGSFDSQKRMWATALQIGLFGTINETRQNVIFSLLTVDIGKTVDDRLDLDQLLFDHTFPAEMRCWPDPRKLAINETELGQKYMDILRASPAKCRPFLSLVELEQYRQRWLDNSSSECDEVLDDFTFGVFRRHFAKLINLVNRIFGENDSANTALPWHANEGCAGRMFEFGRVGSTDIGRHIFNNEKSQLVFSHLQFPFITFGLNTFFWSRLHFDDFNVLRHLRLAELATASVELDQTFLTTWELSFANRSLQNAAKNLFQQSAAQFDADIQLGHNFEPSELSKVIAKLISMLGSLTPPRGLMDPPHFAHIQQMHWRERLQQVDIYLNALQMFLRLTIAKSYDVDQIVAICCASPASSSPLSPHSAAPILRQICVAHRDTANALRQLDSDDTQRTSQERSKSDPFVYRCCWTEGQESNYANHFRHEFVERLRSATAHLTEAIHTATDDASNLLGAFNNLSQSSNDGGGTALHRQSSTTTTTNRLSVAQSHLHNLLSTTSTLKALLTETTTTTSAAETSSPPLPPALFIYPDLVAPYLHVLNLLAIALAELYRQIGSALAVEHIRHKYGFSRVEFDAFTLLLHHCSSSSSSIRQLQNGKQSTDHAVADVAKCTEPFIRWLITDQWCPLTAHQRLPICLWSIASCHSRCQRSGRAIEPMRAMKRRRLINMTNMYSWNRMNKSFAPLTFPTSPIQPLMLNPLMRRAAQRVDKKNVAHRMPFSKPDETDNPSSPLFLSLLHVADKLELYSTAEELDDAVVSYSHLQALGKLRELLQLRVTTTTKFPSTSSSSPSSTLPPLNVYRDSEPSALVHCVQCLAPFQHRVQQLLSEFPENAQLFTLNSSIDTFKHKAPAGAPLMKHAAQLEHILVRAEEWESIADRAHSVRAQMVPLQDVLVEWRRREVHCWASLVDMVRADCAQLAVLAGWPLFKCALDTLQNQKDGGGTVPLLAFVDWMHSATVGDFDARLWTGQLLTKCLHNLAPNCAATATLCRRMRCACAHFAQFGQAVHVHFADRFAPVERSLRDFCRAVRYTDLNVWSVRDSARRAHTQLIRILRDFKNLNDEPVLPLLFDKLSPLLEWTPPTTAQDRLPPNPMAHSEQEETTVAILSRSLTSFVSRLGTSVVRLLDMDALDVLRADAIGMLKELQTHIIYDDCHSVDQQHNLSKPEVDNVRSINEKRHGRALFTRQQQFARLVRTAARIGLNARRAQHIDSEQLTMQTLAETDALERLPETIGTHFRNTTAARNVFLRQFANYRRHQSQQQQQLTPATLQQLRNTVEFALHWMHNAISALGQQRFADAQQRALHIARCIELEAQNAAAALTEDDALSHAHMSSVFVRNGRLINMLTTIIDRMRQLHQLCPRQHSSNSGDDQHQIISSHPSTSIQLSLNAFQTPLGSLRQPSTEHAELDADLSALELLLKRLKRSHSDVLVSSVRVTRDCFGNDDASAMEDNNLHIWKRTNWRTYTDCLREFHSAFSDLSLAKLGTYFVDECAKLGPTFGQLLLIDEEIMVEGRPITAAETNLEFEEVERAILLYLQSIYKEIERYNNNDGNGAPPVLDSVKRVLEFVNKLNSDKVLAQLCDWFFANSSVYNARTSSSSSATTASRLVCGYTLAHGLCSALCHLHHHIGTLVSQLASFHAHWTAIGCHLLTNGFVNPIPAEDRREGAESKRVESGDGFGDADLAPNATDVSSQVENMEQIEGLKENGNDQQQQPMDERNDADQQQQQQMPDVEQPIDVEDDFAGCLEGLDTGEGEEGIDEEDNVEQQHEDIEDRADWNFGDVEEPEETQLDPQLWEPPEEQQQQDNIEEKDGDKQQQPMDECGKGDADPQQQMPEVDQSVGAEDANDKQDWTAVEEAVGDQRHEQLEQDGQKADGEDNDEQQQHEEDMEERDENDIGEVEEQPEEAQLDPQSHGLADEQQDNSEEQVDDQQQQPLNENDDAAQQQKQQQQQKMSDVDQPVGVEDADGHDWTAVEEAGDDKTRQEKLEHDDRAGQGADDEAESSSKQRRTTDGMDEENGRKNDENEDEEMEKNADNDEEIEVGECEQRQLSAHASATLEQARRTRALFSAHLRRLRQKQRQGRAAELASEPSDADGRATDQQKPGKDGDEDEAAGVSDQQRMELDEEDGVEQQQDATGLQNQNIFNTMAEAERHAASMLLSADGAKLDVSADLIERLCADFDSLDQQQNDELQDGRAGDEQRQLQLKWALITDAVAQLAAELAESLRAIIEPTIASRLEGDYRTGKRLNMRRLISYIASDYRKDRIWMRRTRKERRNYQICIAVDNSQSMQHNHMTEITCNALCLIERALRQLEVGQLALCSFGSQVQLIADFAASEHDCDVPPLGVRILRQLRFDQSRTDLAELLDVSQTLFTRAREGGGAVAAPTEQLLIILGDGRGVFSEGVQRIRQAIARLSMDRVTVLFLVMDVPPPSPPSSSSLSSTNKSSSSGTHKSIMDMRIADFSVNGQCTFRPYMAQFPFPLYALVRDTRTLPATVAEAVRQWFEHTATG
uniref:VWFA domain-containing protein n=1 Tax=Globodera rostochiensis TaxID=31243 RepID=A0A914HG89_GLORO